MAVAVADIGSAANSRGCQPQHLFSMADDEEVQALPLTPDMVSSGLSQIARTLDGLSYAYVRLSIAGKGVTELGSTLTKFEHLRYIDASKNRLEDADSLATLKGLLFVDLRQNALKRVPSFSNPYLQVVRLANNKIRSLEGVDAPALTMISLDGKWNDAVWALAGDTGAPHRTATPRRSAQTTSWAPWKAVACCEGWKRWRLGGTKSSPPRGWASFLDCESCTWCEMASLPGSEARLTYVLP